MAHLLLEKAFVYDTPSNNISYQGNHYDHLRGFWIDENKKIPSVTTEDFKPLRTKKADVETGEDKKGE